MATAAVYIKDALTEINVLSEFDDLEPEMGQHGLRRLNQMMSLWKIKDLDLGYFDLSATTEEVAIPDWADLAVTMGLAVVLAPKYGKTVSAEMLGVTMSSIQGIETKLMVEAKVPVDMSYLPVGSGHYGRGNSILTDR